MKAKLTTLLPYAGALPFLCGAIFMVLNINELPLLGSTQAALLSYGLLIVSFMAGVHWGQYLSGARPSVNLLFSSNAVALLAWFGFLVLPAILFCILLIALFATLYIIDLQLHTNSQYLNTRRNVTALVCLSLAVAAFA